MSESSGHRDAYEITRVDIGGGLDVVYELHVRYPYANNLWIHNTLNVNSKIGTLPNWRSVNLDTPKYFGSAYAQLVYSDAEAREQAIPALVALIRQLAPKADVLMDGQEHGLREKFAAWLKAQSSKRVASSK